MSEPKYHNEAGLKAALERLHYPVPEGAARVPWLETLDVTLASGVPEDLNVDHNIERENVFVDLTIEGVKTALSKLKYLNEPYARPPDFLAEMMKSDAHMRFVLRQLERDF